MLTRNEAINEVLAIPLRSGGCGVGATGVTMMIAEVGE